MRETYNVRVRRTGVQDINERGSHQAAGTGNCVAALIPMASAVHVRARYQLGGARAACHYLQIATPLSAETSYASAHNQQLNLCRISDSSSFRLW